jgi:hypothetical protein
MGRSGSLDPSSRCVVQPVTDRRVRLGEQVAEAIQGEAHRGIAGPDRDLLRGAEGRLTWTQNKMPRTIGRDTCTAE